MWQLRFSNETSLDYSDGVRVHVLKMPNGIGTHMDAPNHFIEGAKDIASLDVQELSSPGVMIDISHKADEFYKLSVDDIHDFEKEHGLISEGAIVIVFTGWSHKWQNVTAYRNADSNGMMNFPVISAAAAELFLKRKVNGIAIDTLSPDRPDSEFPVHKILLGAGKFIIENIKIDDELPAVNFTVLALPMKIKSATEAPCRIVALLGEVV